MGIQEPMVPPFPMSDYGTGIMGAIVALLGVLERSRKGGSWWGGVSLVGYDMFLFRLGMYPDEVWYYIPFRCVFVSLSWIVFHSLHFSPAAAMNSRASPLVSHSLTWVISVPCILLPCLCPLLRILP